MVGWYTEMGSFNPSTLPDLSGKIFIVTGGNNGIGKTTTLHLLKKRAKVYIAARNPTKSQNTIAELRALVPDALVEALRLDLSSLASVKAAAEEYVSKESELHGLVNNAGVMGLPYELSVDGYELQWGTNYMGHYLLTKLLLPTLLRTAKTAKDPVRIVNLSSVGHSSAPKAGIVFDDVNLPNSGAMERYGQSKLANILHTKALAKRYGGKEDNIIVVALHPGAVRTNLSDGFLTSKGIPTFLMTIMSPFLMTAEKGCWTTLYAAAGQGVTWEDNGAYFTPFGKRTEPSAVAGDEGLAEKLWEWTEGNLRGKGY